MPHAKISTAHLGAKSHWGQDFARMAHDLSVLRQNLLDAKHLA